MTVAPETNWKPFVSRMPRSRQYQRRLPHRQPGVGPPTQHGRHPNPELTDIVACPAGCCGRRTADHQRTVDLGSEVNTTSGSDSRRGSLTLRCAGHVAGHRGHRGGSAFSQSGNATTPHPLNLLPVRGVTASRPRNLCRSSRGQHWRYRPAVAIGREIAPNSLYRRLISFKTTSDTWWLLQRETTNRPIRSVGCNRTQPKSSSQHGWSFTGFADKSLSRPSRC
jgi:hypothetical protein